MGGRGWSNKGRMGGNRRKNWENVYLTKTSDLIKMSYSPQLKQ
jgi:hypothetical protein